MKSRCTNCKRIFDVEIKHEEKNDDLHEIYFECPKCKHRYHIAYTNKATRELNFEMQGVKIELLKDKTNQQLFTRMQGLMRKHKDMMDQLNNRQRAVV
jgi:DNA-directed RNA polymerase subunit RPC12/RpoP